MSSGITKKRELLPSLNECIIAMSNMSGDVANLEIHDNDDRSRKLKRALARFENGPYKKFKEEVLGVREVIKNKKPKTKNNRNHESESEKLRRSECSEQQSSLGTTEKHEHPRVSDDAGGLF